MFIPETLAFVLNQISDLLQNKGVNNLHIICFQNVGKYICIFQCVYNTGKFWDLQFYKPDKILDRFRKECMNRTNILKNLVAVLGVWRVFASLVSLRHTVLEDSSNFVYAFPCWTVMRICIGWCWCGMEICKGQTLVFILRGGKNSSCSLQPGAESKVPVLSHTEA